MTKRKQQRERDEEREYRQMKPKRLQSAETVIDRQQRRDERAIRLIARQRTERRRVAEKHRNVPHFPDGRVVFNCVRVVEVEAVVKMVRVGREEGDEQRKCTQRSETSVAQRDRNAFKHRAILARASAGEKC